MKSAFLYQTWPYAAVVLFGAGMVVRYRIAREAIYTNPLRSLQPGNLMGGSRLLQFSLFLLLLGHLAGLLLPHWIQVWNSDASRLYLIETLGFGIGVSALAGWALIMKRHLERSDGPMVRQIADAVFFSLLFTVLVSGSLTAIIFRWGSSWSAQTFSPYTLSLLRGQPAVGLVVNLPFLVRLHVFASFAALALFPATSFVWAPIVVFRRGLVWALAPVQSVVDFVVKAGTRLNPAIWIWPEED